MKIISLLKKIPAFIVGLVFSVILFNICFFVYKIRFIDNKKFSVIPNVNAATSSCVEFGNKYKNIVAYSRQNIFPVGSIYVSIVNKNPSSIFGGTWSRYAQGKTLVGVNESESEFNTVNKSGGKKTHTLTINEIPSHEGHFYAKGGTAGYYLSKDKLEIYNTVGRGWVLVGGKEMIPASYSRGSSRAHNNLQPYTTVYIWRRVG